MLHKDYMLKHKPIEVTIMTAEGRFWQYLAEIDKQATEMFNLLVEQMKGASNVTKRLKVHNNPKTHNIKTYNDILFYQFNI